MKREFITNRFPKVYFVMKMLISRGYWPPFWLCVSPAEDRAFVHCRHLMTVILNTHRMLSRFCLHSYQNEVLGGPHLSITAGLQLFASLWPGFSSRAYKLSLNSVEQGPFNPLLSLSPDKCSSAASPRHMPPSYLLLSSIRWPALHSHMVHCEPLYLYGCWKPRITQCFYIHSYDLHPFCQMSFFSSALNWAFVGQRLCTLRTSASMIQTQHVWLYFFIYSVKSVNTQYSQYCDTI